MDVCSLGLYKWLFLLGPGSLMLLGVSSQPREVVVASLRNTRATCRHFAASFFFRRQIGSRLHQISTMQEAHSMMGLASPLYFSQIIQHASGFVPKSSASGPPVGSSKQDRRALKIGVGGFKATTFSYMFPLRKSNKEAP